MITKLFNGNQAHLNKFNHRHVIKNLYTFKRWRVHIIVSSPLFLFPPCPLFAPLFAPLFLAQVPFPRFLSPSLPLCFPLFSPGRVSCAFSDWPVPACAASCLRVPRPPVCRCCGWLAFSLAPGLLAPPLSLSETWSGDVVQRGQNEC